MAKSVVAFSLKEFDPSYTRVLINNADFGNSKITDLGTLEVITGFANFRDGQVKNLGNLTTIGGNANFKRSQLKSLDNLTTIGGYAYFEGSEIRDLGNLTTIEGNADFSFSQVEDLGNLTTIGGDADFRGSQVEDLGKLKTIKGFVSFDNQELADQWKKRSNKDNFKTGGQSLSKTPAPKKERIYGSEKNKPESSKDTKSAEKIEFNEKTLETIKNKVAEHNKKHPNKKVTLASAKAVVRRGMGAYSSTHRPTISGGKPNSRVAWGLARLNAFFYKIINGKSKSGKYSQDDDLINELGYKVKKYEIGGIFHGSRYRFDKFNTNKIGSGIGQQDSGWGIYLTDDKESSKSYGNYIYETTLFKGKKIGEYNFIDEDKPVKKDLVRKIVEALYKYYNKEFDINKFNLYYEYIKDKSLPKVDFNDYELIEFAYSGYLFYKTLSRTLGGDKKASLFLLNNGIDGSIKQFKNHKGEIYRTDYVIYDENAITINNTEYSKHLWSDGGLIAPNGNPSNLTPEQYKLVRTPAFKEWFGDWEKDPANASKVVDENGEPKVMWHYSPNEFTIFNPSAESRWVNQRKENVVWFGGNEKVISYSEGEKGFLYQCFLNVKKPIIVDAKKYDEYDYYKDEQGNKNYSIQRIKGSFVSKLGSVSWDGKRNENDGVIFYNAWDNISLGVVVAVPNPNQIKLADGTNTTFDGENPDIRFMAGGQVLNLNKIRKGQYEAKSDKIEIFLTNPKVLNGMGTNKWQLIIEYSNDIIVNQWFDTMNEALKTGAILLSDFLDSNNTETRFMAGGRTKKPKTDRSGNYIGDGNFHVDYFVEDMTEYPQVKISVSKSDSTESVYVRYFNEDNAESITLRFSMHENNAVKFGYQLNGYTASKNEILYELGLINRKFVPNTYLSITKRQVKKVDLPKYEESNLSIKEMYDLGEGADISMHKGKIAKGSNYLIQGDTVEKIIADTGRFEYFVNGGNVPKKRRRKKGA